MSCCFTKINNSNIKINNVVIKIGNAVRVGVRKLVVAMKIFDALFEK